MVTATEIAKRFGIPRRTVYYLAQTKRIPAVDQRSDWHDQAKWRFNVREVREALDRMHEARQPAPPREP